jgi:uncharacterized membrane protein
LLTCAGSSEAHNVAISYSGRDHCRDAVCMMSINSFDHADLASAATRADNK